MTYLQPTRHPYFESQNLHHIFQKQIIVSFATWILAKQIPINVLELIAIRYPTDNWAKVKTYNKFSSYKIIDSNLRR